MDIQTPTAFVMIQLLRGDERIIILQLNWLQLCHDLTNVF